MGGSDPRIRTNDCRRRESRGCMPKVCVLICASVSSRAFLREGDREQNLQQQGRNPCPISTQLEVCGDRKLLLQAETRAQHEGVANDGGSFKSRWVRLVDAVSSKKENRTSPFRAEQNKAGGCCRRYYTAADVDIVVVVLTGISPHCGGEPDQDTSPVSTAADSRQRAQGDRLLCAPSCGTSHQETNSHTLRAQQKQSKQKEEARARLNTNIEERGLPPHDAARFFTHTQARNRERGGKSPVRKSVSHRCSRAPRVLSPSEATQLLVQLSVRV